MEVANYGRTRAANDGITLRRFLSPTTGISAEALAAKSRTVFSKKNIDYAIGFLRNDAEMMRAARQTYAAIMEGGKATQAQAARTQRQRAIPAATTVAMTGKDVREKTALLVDKIGSEKPVSLSECQDVLFDAKAHGEASAGFQLLLAMVDSGGILSPCGWSFARVAAAARAAHDLEVCEGVMHLWERSWREGQLDMLESDAATAGSHMLSSAISLCAAKGHFKSIDSAIALAIESGIQVGPSHFNTVLVALARRGRSDDVEEFYRNMRKGFCEPDMYTYRALSRVRAETGNLEGAQSILDEVVHRGMLSGQLGLDVLNNCVQAAACAGVSPLRATYGSRRTMGDVVALAERAFMEIEISGMEPNRASYMSLMKAYSRAGCVHDALALMEKWLQDPHLGGDMNSEHGTRKVFKMCIEAFASAQIVPRLEAKRRKYELARANALKEQYSFFGPQADKWVALDSDTPLSADWYAGRIGGFKESSLVQDDGDEMLRLEASDISNAAETLGVADFSEYDDWEEEEEEEEENEEEDEQEEGGVDPRLFHIAPKIAEAYLSEEVNETLSEDASTARLPLLPMEGEAAIEESEEVLRRLTEDLGIAPDAGILNAVLSVYCRAGRLRRAEKFMEIEFDQNGVSPDVRTFTILAAMFCAAQKPSEALRMFSAAESRNVIPDQEMYGVVLRWCVAKKDASLAEDLVKEMQLRGIDVAKRDIRLLEEAHF